MGKDKKSSKGKQEKDFGPEVVDAIAASDEAGSKNKKGRKKKNEDWEENFSKEIDSLSLEDGNQVSKKTKNKDANKNHAPSVESDSEDDSRQKRKQKGNAPANRMSDDEEPKTKPSKKSKARKDSAEFDEEEDTGREKRKTKKGVVSNGDVPPNKKESKSKGNSKEVSKEPKKKSKSKKAAASDDEDDEEEVVTSRSKVGGKASAFQMLLMEEGSGESQDSQSETEEPELEVVQVDKKAGKKSKKKERRKNLDDEEVDKMLEELALEIEGKKPLAASAKLKEASPDAAEVLEKTDVIQEEPEKTEKKKKKKKQQPAELEDVKPTDEAQEAQEDEEGHTVKTAAQKKKEKKEREKQKKVALSTQDKAKKSKTVLKEPEPDVKEPSPKDEEEQIDQEDDEDDGKKKKKKKKGEEDDKKDKKRPGKKQVLAMQDALKKLKEEEERRKEEEEQKQKAAEEAERLRELQKQLELERKERKKQKEKEKRERLKAEGKLLTKAQKQARARMEATLQALRQQGLEVPQIGEKREKAPRLGDRRKPIKKKVEEQTETKNETEVADVSEIPQVEVEIVGPQATEKEVVEDVTPETPTDDVKDAWDESTEDEEEEVTIKQKKATPKTTPKKPVVEEESEDESDDDSGSSEGSEDEESSEESSEEEEEMSKQDKVRERMRKRKEEAEKKRSLDKLRSPIVCVLGHVDTGKTKILDKIRNSHVQDGEAGGITQQIGATMIPQDALKEQCKMVKNFMNLELKLPGLLIIDTPGHESFSNLRSRGSSLCDIAILVVDIMHGLEPQTIESINLLKKKKTPFIVALNKIDRLYEWRSNRHKDVQDVITSQQRNTKQEFEERTKEVILQFNEQALNAALFYENEDPRTYVSLVPTSAATGDGMGNLMSLVVDLTQNIMPKKLAYSEDLQATVLEVKAIPGLGTTIDVILVNGSLREGDTMILAGHDGPVVTQIRSLLMPQPMKELRVKTPYQEFKEIEAAQGVKITGKDLDKSIAGLQLLVALHPDEVEILKDEVNNMLKEVMNAIKLSERGVYVQASTLGSLEALLEFLRTSKIPYSGIRIGPVVKKDVMKASIMLEHDSQYAVILAFDVKVERDAQDLADSLGVKIFQADIIYHLFDKFMAYRDELKQKRRDEFKHVAVFPCRLRILPQFIFNTRDPIVLGVSVEAGVLKEGTPICVPSREFLEIGTVTTIEINHKTVEVARKGQEVCIKIDSLSGESPKMFGRHFDQTDALISKITRQSIDACKEYFRDDLQKTDWQLMVDLKKLFQIM